MQDSYPWLWARQAYRGLWAKGTAWGGGISGFLPVASHFAPSWTSTLGDLAWQVPLFALVGAACLRVVLSPYELWREQKERAETATASLAAEWANTSSIDAAELRKVRAEIKAKADVMRRRHQVQNITIAGASDDALADMWDNIQNGTPVDKYGQRLSDKVSSPFNGRLFGNLGQELADMHERDRLDRLAREAKERREKYGEG